MNGVKAALRRFVVDPLFWTILAFFLVAIFADSVASYVTMQQQLPVLSDALLDHLPFLPVFWVYDIVSVILIFLLVQRLYRDGLEDVPYVLLLLGMLQFFRAVCIYINPIAPPANSPYGLLELFSATPDAHQGSIPSGHVMWGAFIALYLRGKERWLATGLVVLLVLSMLFSRAHYFIDLVVGALAGYTIYVFGDRVLRPRLAKRGLARRQKRF